MTRPAKEGFLWGFLSFYSIVIILSSILTIKQSKTETF
jgi:hypothetical protein